MRVPVELAETMSREIKLDLICDRDSSILKERGLTTRRGPRLPGDSVRLQMLGPLIAMNSVRVLRKILTDYDVVIANYSANMVAPFAHPRVLYYCYEPYQPFYDPEYVSTFSAKRRAFLMATKPLYVPLDKRAASHVHTFMTLDKFTVGEISRIYNRPAVVVGAGVNTDFFKRTPDPDLERTYDGKKVILSLVKDLKPITGVDYLLAALPRIIKAVPDTLLLLATTVPDRKRMDTLLRLADRLGVAQHLRFLSFIPEEKLPSYYSIASVAAHPLFYANTVLMNKEAMACETPVVMWRGRTTEDIGDSNGGIAVPDRSVSGLAEAIIQILSSPELAHQMGIAGRKRVLEKFALGKVASNILDVARKAVRDTGQGR